MDKMGDDSFDLVRFSQSSVSSGPGNKPTTASSLSRRFKMEAQHVFFGTSA